MKKSFTIIAALFLTCLTVVNAFAQENTSTKKDKPSNIGLFVGLNRGSADFESSFYEADANTGYEIGLFVRSGKWAYVQSGLTYMKLSQQLTSSSEKDNLSISRLEVPVYLGLNVLPIGQKIFNIRGFAGPTFSYAIGVKENDLDIDASDINRFQMDIGAGVGLDILFMKLDLGFNYGLSNLISGEKSHVNYGFLTFGLGF